MSGHQLIRCATADEGALGQGLRFGVDVTAARTGVDQHDLQRAVLDQFVDGAIDPVIEDADYCRAALSLLPDETFDAQTWSRWTAAIKEQTGRKGKMLFHPLRLALTGHESGPELAQLLPLIGRLKAAGRLSGQSS